MATKKTIRAMVLCALFATACAPAQSRVIYVDDDAPPGGDGRSWQAAYPYLQDALADARAADSPVEIRIAQGTYKPDQGVGIRAGDKEATFRMLNGVTIKGGYAGCGASDPNLRSIDLYRSTLSGDLGGDDAAIAGSSELLGDANRYGNSYHVVTGKAVDETAVLDGFVITGGFFVGVFPSSGIRQGGAGLYNDAASPTIIECTFLSNCAVAGSGAGVFNANNSDPTFICCTFLGNSAGQGGAVCNAQNSNAGFEDCLFVGNLAYHGAGMYNRQSGPELTGCTFRANRAEPFGGAVYSVDSQLVLTACSFMENKADGNMSYAAMGGAIFDSGGTVQFARCLFKSNGAERGGAVYCEDSTITVTDCVFLGNGVRPRGSAIALTDGGAICSSHTKLSLAKCQFTGNSSRYTGGALAISFGSGEVRNCLLTGNAAGWWGGGILTYRSQLFLNGCTLVGNRALRGSALDDDSGTSVTTNSIYAGHPTNLISGSATITYSNIAGGWPDEGNMDVNSHFVAAGHWDPNGTENDPNDDIWVDGDYHLKSQAGRWDPNSQSWVIDDVTSPCIDAGDPNSPIGYEPFPNGGRINMGAYGGTAKASKSYFGQPLCETPIAGDINGDCTVDFEDLVILLNHWLQRGERAEE